MLEFNKNKILRYTIGAAIVTPIAIVLGVISTGFGHGDYLFAKLLFPFTMLSTLRTSDTVAMLSLIFALLQFLMYGAVLAIGSLFKRDVILVVIIVFVHVAAVVMCFVLIKPNLSYEPESEVPLRAPPEEVLTWLQENAIHLRTVETGSGFEDMQPLKKVIGGARLVCLGEATHGTREFFQMKHRMLEFLVSEMGFTLFGIEATMPEAFDINKYVLTGEGDPRMALAGLYFWTWDTEEVLDMIKWMRQYNADPAHTRKVKFYGFDMQVGSRAARVVLEYLRRVDPEQAKASEQMLSVLANPWESHREKLQMATKQKKRELLDSANSLLDHFDKQKNSYIQKTSLNEWKIARQHARILSQFLEQNKAGYFTEVRDRSMAENIRWILDFEGLDSKIVVWAHNGHVAIDKSYGVRTMGAHLRDMFGSEMVIFGFAFNEGGFQAIKMGGGLLPFTIEPAPEGTLDATLVAAGLSIAAIDLRALPKAGPVAEFFGRPLKTRTIGAGYIEDRSEIYLVSHEVGKRYDALLFIEKTTVARVLPLGLCPTRGKLHEPANLDFEKTTADGKPADWTIKRGLSSLEFQTSVSDDQPYGGNYCAMISRDPGQHYGETFGNLSQRIKVKDYRGKRVRLRAVARVEGIGPASQAYLWLRVDKMRGPSLFYEQPIHSDQWQEYELMGDVVPKAAMINYGLAFVGEGKAWIDDVSLTAEANIPTPDMQSRISGRTVFIVCILAGLLLSGVLLGLFLARRVKQRDKEHKLKS